MEPAKIAVIASAFDHRLNYQESVSARTLHRAGHEVRVFTTDAAIVRDERDWAEVDARCPFPVVRTPRYWRWRNTMVPRDPAMAGALRDFRPDWAFLFAPAGGVGVSLMRHLPESCRVVAFISDLPWHRSSRMLWHLVKRPWLRRVFRRADVVAAVTEDTAEMLRGIGDSLLDGKLVMTGLSYDGLVFTETGGRCPEAVVALRERCPRIFCTVTKASPSKQLDEVVAAAEEVLREDAGAGFVLAGVGLDEYGEGLRRQVAASPWAERMVVLPVLEAEEVKGVFEVSAAAVFTLVSIGIQQALACGCPVVLRSGQPAGHILSPGVNSEEFGEFGELAAAVRRLMVRGPSREAVRLSIAPWRSDLVLARVMELARARRGVE
jgi:glycosyltransferase involved in cell wall biosynthesis